MDDHSGCWGPRDVRTAREPFDMLNMFDTDDMLAKMATDKMLVINMILGYEEAVMGRSDKELLSVLTGGLRGLVSGGRVGSWRSTERGNLGGRQGGRTRNDDSP